MGSFFSLPATRERATSTNQAPKPGRQLRARSCSLRNVQVTSRERVPTVPPAPHDPSHRQKDTHESTRTHKRTQAGEKVYSWMASFVCAGGLPRRGTSPSKRLCTQKVDALLNPVCAPQGRDLCVCQLRGPTSLVSYCVTQLPLQSLENLSAFFPPKWTRFSQGLKPESSTTWFFLAQGANIPSYLRKATRLTLRSPPLQGHSGPFQLFSPRTLAEPRCPGHPPLLTWDSCSLSARGRCKNTHRKGPGLGTATWVLPAFPNGRVLPETAQPQGHVELRLIFPLQSQPSACLGGPREGRRSRERSRPVKARVSATPLWVACALAVPSEAQKSLARLGSKGSFRTLSAAGTSSQAHRQRAFLPG